MHRMDLGNLVPVIRFLHVDGKKTRHAGNRAARTMHRHPLAPDEGLIDSTDPLEIEKSLIGNM